ncbi:MAG: DUF1844 domain-containing protein [Phycisphaeraceae bacterium]|nr:DUF1844 domain-containing protein [Phycisphaeraceae bacterium]MBX3366428.1 DUF1844 domain-containing protein [Phycisphaeraceae bacterium]QYK47123.1 MAG: DUF1844 domain-containing protein [Phycisphaeraceae bacterium]
MADEQPKIIVDSDWKAQAQAEKERLAAKEAAAKPAAASPGGSPGSPPAAAEEAEPTLFEELLRMLATQALLYMGAFPDPSTGQAVLSPEMAKLHIDMLGELEAKTKGNLSEHESKTLTSYLYELRMQYVEVSREIARLIKEGKIRPGSGQGGVSVAGPGGIPQNPSMM